MKPALPSNAASPSVTMWRPYSCHPPASPTLARRARTETRDTLALSTAHR